MSVATIDMPDKLVPVFEGEADVRGAKGGRGSAKTRTFAKMTAVRAYAWEMAGRDGMILCARQFMNSLDESSLEEVKAAIRSEEWLEPYFEIGEKFIRTRSGRISYGFAGLSRNLNSIKSKSRILLAWVDEAENVSEEAWIKLIPTLREEDSELWLTWNPELRHSPTNKRFGDDRPDDSRVKIATVNWRDNPWFPEILNRQRLRDQAERPEHYGHIWEGEFITAHAGAYYAKQLQSAREDRRIGNIAADPLIRKRAFFDIGFNDFTSIWVGQIVGTELRFLDYYEARHQPLAAHLEWLRANGHGDVEIVLPHDGANANAVTGTRYADHVRGAGFEDVHVVPNQGRGADMRRIEAARRIFPACRFDETRCATGIERLSLYHEQVSTRTGTGLGPDHDDNSHAADAFGLACVTYEQLREPVREAVPVRHRVMSGGGAWMGGR